MRNGFCAGILLCVCALPALAGDRDKAMALLVSVDGLIAKGELDNAIDMCKRAIAEDDSCPMAYFKLAQAQEQKRNVKDAFRDYQTAAELARKDKDPQLVVKAQVAAEKLGGGAAQMSTADTKLIDKLSALGDDALADDQYETARSAYESILALRPTHAKAREGLDKAEKAIQARGDPVKARLAAAMLAEVFYNVGNGKKEDAAKMAQDIVKRHGETKAGKEAVALLANDFGPPKTEQMAEVKKQLKEQTQKAKKVAATRPPTNVSATVAPPPPVDVDGMEKAATEDAKKLPKTSLVATFKETFLKGKEAYGKATPGSEGNQKNVAIALESFIRCEQLFMRIEDEKLVNDDVSGMEKQASMLRYACMKMTILSH